MESLEALESLEQQLRRRQEWSNQWVAACIHLGFAVGSLLLLWLSFKTGFLD